jgi:hypothetical protein
MNVEQELDLMKRDDESLGMNKIQVVCRLPETVLGFKEELCSLETVI